MRRLSVNIKFFLIIFTILFTIFIFTTDAHRYTTDEDFAEEQAKRIFTQKPDPLYVQGVSKLGFQYPSVYYNPQGSVCLNPLLCYSAYVGHSVIEVPFLFVNHFLHVITEDTVVWTTNDFDDPNYIVWRNSIDPDFTFLELFYGPLFSALSVGIFFLICRSFNFEVKNSLMLSLLYGMSTLVWAYSKTSLNSVSMTFFVLLGFLFFRNFQNNRSNVNLILCGMSMGFGFLIRPDTALFIVPLFVFFLFNLRKRNEKVRNLLYFILPLVCFYILYFEINSIRFGNVSVASAVKGSATAFLAPAVNPFLEGVFGLLLSPGVGLLIFVPILFTIFLAFPDFYKRNKGESVLFLSFVSLFLIYYGSGIGGWWHGLVAWGPRYLLPVVPFFILPLGSSLENKKSKLFKVFLVTLGGMGFFFNIVYVIQDVSWFVWGNPSLHTGLYGLAAAGQYDVSIHPATLWTFEFSQLTQSIVTAFTHLQPDVFLLKILGGPAYGIVLTVILIPLIFSLYHVLREQKIPQT